MEVDDLGSQTLPQIAEKLNENFQGTKREIIFWYDKNQEFEEDIEDLSHMVDGDIYTLKENSQFKAKLYLTKEYPDKNFLVYAPFAKPAIRKNLLADLLYFSKEFYTDRISMVMSESKIGSELRAVMESHARFFESKDRRNRFNQLIENNPTETELKLTMLATLAKVRNSTSLESILMTVLTTGKIDENAILIDFSKFDLLDFFWEIVGKNYGFYHALPSLNRLVLAMYINYFYLLMEDSSVEIPERLAEFKMSKQGSLGAFMGNFKNNVLTSERFDQLAGVVFKQIQGEDILNSITADTLIENDVFAEINHYLIAWVIDRLENGDHQAKIGTLDIPGLCNNRVQLHYGKVYKQEFQMIKYASYLLRLKDESFISDSETLISLYETEYFQVDTYYRKFYYHYDQISDIAKERVANLRQLVENLYNYNFLEEINLAWSSGFDYAELSKVVPLQTNFYKERVMKRKGKVVVIISDALRYEAVRELEKRLSMDTRYNTSVSSMLGVLPSITKVGKAALLPNNELSISEDYNVLVDNMSTVTTVDREKVLQKHFTGSKAITYKEIALLKRDDMRNLFSKQDAEVIYVYHDAIDAIGDKSLTENNVFDATEQAIEEIEQLVEKFANNLSISNFFVTSDHGYIYKRDVIAEAAKIDNPKLSGDEDGRRYIISNHRYEGPGIQAVKLGDVLRNSDKRFVNFPKTTGIFKKAGGGQNYVHGGASIQEMLIPILEVHRERGQSETRTAEIQLLSGNRIISNLFTNLEFIQKDIVGESILPSKYSLYFESKDGARISDEQIHVTDNMSVAPSNRMFRVNFQLKEEVYNKSQPYYLVMYDLVNEVIGQKHEFHIDIAFSGGFGIDN